jgi:hypothetical protein
MVFEFGNYALQIIIARALKRKTPEIIETTGEHAIARIVRKIKFVLICVRRLLQIFHVNFIARETKDRGLRLLN